MRVRNMAVVGAAMVAALAGGAGIAQADDEGGALPTCIDLSAAAVVAEGSPEIDPCLELPDDCELIPLLAAEGAPVSVDAVHPEFPCGDDITIDVEGDCENPEEFTFTVNATGLNPNAKYNALLGVDPLGDTDLIFSFTADANGDVKGFQYVETEAADGFDFPAGAFTLYYLVGPDEGLDFPTFGAVDVEECKPVVVDPVVVVPPAAQPAPVAAPVAAPVHVTPVAAHPAVLANAGSPVTSAALLGGGLLVVGAGAMVATRRRAS